MSYFDHAMKAEVLRRIESFTDDFKISVRVEDKRTLVISILKSEINLIEKMVNFYKTYDSEEAEHVSKSGIVDFTYFEKKTIDKIKEFDLEMALFLSKIINIAKLQGDPDFEHYAEYNSMDDSSRVAYFLRLSIGDKQKDKPFEHIVKKAKVKKLAG